MTPAAFTRRALSEWIYPVVFGVSFGVLAAFLVVLKPEDLRPRVEAACDRAVASLLAARDMVELERSKYRIKVLDCSVRKRLLAADPSN